MVECECIHKLKDCRCVTVLIDTWWNVNKLVYTVQCTRDLVLIDTWWNVNPCEYINSLFCRSSFNRYMVECESISPLLLLFHFLVLIDTWWNVNMGCYRRSVVVCTVLIDTWWNVNYTDTYPVYSGALF